MPTTAGAVVAEEMTGSAAALTVMTSVAEDVPPALVALMATELTPVAVGVPVMAPVDRLTDSPAGSPVALNDVAPLATI